MKVPAMGEDDPRREIERLEARIEQLADTIERCRKLMLIAKVAIGLGGAALAAALLGAIGSDPTAFIAGTAAVIGGIVLIGSNSSTAEEARANLAAAEAERTALIGGIELRLVGANGASPPAGRGGLP
jgi:uncharacterized membrane protein YeaQ/YmgE (transglycosylase-associated protein family)